LKLGSSSVRKLCFLTTFQQYLKWEKVRGFHEVSVSHCKHCIGIFILSSVRVVDFVKNIKLKGFGVTVLCCCVVFNIHV
jgi:hypothetical protein